MYDRDCRLGLAHLPMKYSGLYSGFRNADPQANKGVCSHLISALKDETSFETAKHTQTTATAKAAIRTSRGSLHEQELKRITGPIPAATKRNILRSQETGKWLQTPPSYVNGTCLSCRCIASSILENTTQFPHSLRKFWSYIAHGTWA